MALIRPSGMATIMAMIAPMKMVPQNSGIAPNAPDEPAWSGRIAVCGLQLVPNRNSMGETRLKKRSDSNRSERTMPSVVRIDQGCEEEEPHHQSPDPSAGAEMRREARSDENTSEVQLLMRNSYAVSCLT